MLLLVQIADDTCPEGEFYEFRLPLDTNKARIAEAIETLYPACTEYTVTTTEE